jgi:ATP synthase I chain
MSEIEDSRLERRLARNTYLVIGVALAVAAIAGGLEMAMGVLLGGALCLFNHRWLTGSVRAILTQAAAAQSGRLPPFTSSKFFLRYVIIAGIFGLAVWQGGFHPLGIGIGFAAFAGGVMLEAGYQIYLFFKSYNHSSSEE